MTLKIDLSHYRALITGVSNNSCVQESLIDVRLLNFIYL